MIQATIHMMAGFGLAIGPATAIYIICFAYVFIAVAIIWAVGLVQGNHSMMDGYYGWAYASVGWIAYLLARPSSAAAGILLLGVSLHGVRLGFYLFKRWFGYRKTTGGDARYLGFIKTLSPGYWWKSFFVVLEPQTIVILVISLPVVYGIAAHPDVAAKLTPLAYLGMIVLGIGLYYEWLADGQLQAFKQDPTHKGRYLEHGVWALSRHPNYFGNTVVWWGLWLIAVSDNPHIWWTVAGPIFNTVMLTQVLGVAFQDRFMGSRPEYQEMMKRRGGFIPRLW